MFRFRTEKTRVSWMTVTALTLAFSTGALPAHASFHFMQIEQVIGGVNGDIEAQAIQLRMRQNSQNIVSRTRLVARDAGGANPIVLLDMQADVSSALTGSRVLVVSEKFSLYTTPEIEPDFVMTKTIPEDYLAAGTLLFENDESTLLVWRLSWGGTAYGGLGDGALTNDDDGEFSPAYLDSLPAATLQALIFGGLAESKGTTNAADYSLTAGAAVFTNNAGETFTVQELQCIDDDGDFVCDDTDNCLEAANQDQADSDGDAVGDACDGCPADDQKTEPGVCGCGLDDDGDDDADDIVDCVDNCPGLSNADQADRDGDDAGDACDDCPDNPDIVHAGAGGCEAPPDDNGNDNDDSDNDNGNGNGNDDDGSPDDGGEGVSPAPRSCGVGLIPPLLALAILSLLGGPTRSRTSELH